MYVYIYICVYIYILIYAEYIYIYIYVSSGYSTELWKPWPIELDDKPDDLPIKAVTFHSYDR